MTKPILNAFKEQLSEPAWRLCNRGIDMMRVSKDPYHDETHIERMLSDFKNLLSDIPNLVHELNVEVVVLSICWHDSWKSGRVGRNSLELLYHQFKDGIGSVGIFEAAAKEEPLNPEVRKQVSYSIRKHAQFQFLPVNTLEAHVLRDLDDLDLWSQERLERGKGVFAFATRWRLAIFRRAIITQKLNSEWATQQREKRAVSFLKYLEEHANSLHASK